MKVKVHFYSYFREFTQCESYEDEVPTGSTLGQLIERVLVKFPRMAGMKSSMLTAVGVEYQRAEYLLREGDEVSLFPPVQGG